MKSNVLKIRREVLIRMAQAFFENKLDEKIDRIPLEMRPRNESATRCCVYKDRAVLKYRIMAALGFAIEDETDELTPLRDYLKTANEVKHENNSHLTILTEACSSCIQTHYQITNACRGCVARPCTLNCPKNAVEFRNGKAEINPDLCVNCGKCMQVCPYQAIIRIPIPCEEACPTGAITKDENGKESIDFEKCILCGKCLQACPFGAIAERSQIIPVLKALTGSTHTTALIAPAAVGQFPGDFEQMHRALLELGFDKMLEVALGADLTVQAEAAEFAEKMEAGEKLMTTSCCPAYVNTIKRFHPELEKYVSDTPSPMIFAARLAREKNPETRTVFIGPCLAKRQEASQANDVDFVLTFEELGALFVAKGIDVAECEPLKWSDHACQAGRSFPMSGGVAGAIKSIIGDEIELKPEIINGLDRRAIKQLKATFLNRLEGNFVEVMACEGGCVAGPGVLTKSQIASRKVMDFAKAGAELINI